MVNEDLLKYIQTQKNRGVSKEDIRTKLLSAGWEEINVKEGMDQVFGSGVAPTTEAQAPIATMNTNTNLGTSFTPRYKPIVENVSNPEPVVRSAGTFAPQNNSNIPNLMPKVRGPEQTANSNFNQFPQANIGSPEMGGFRPTPVYRPAPQVDMMSTGPLPSGAMTSSFRKDYVDTTQTPTQKKGFSFGGFLLTLFIIILLGAGGAVFAHMKGFITLPFDLPFLTPTPEQALQKMQLAMSNLSTGSFDTDAKFSYKIKTEDSGEKSGFDTGSSMDSMDAKLEISANTDFDISEKENPKMNSKIEAKIAFLFFNFGVDFDITRIKDTLYFKIPDTEMLKDLAPGVDWVMIEKSYLEDPNGLAKDLGGNGEEGMGEIEYSPAQLEKINKLFTDTKFLESIEELPAEELEGKQARHIKVIMDQNKLKEFFDELLKILDEKNQIPQEEKEFFNKFFGGIKELEVNLWIEKGTYYLKKFSFKLSSQMDVTEELSGGMDQDNKNTEKTIYTIDMDMTSELKNVNKKVEISAPNNSKNIKDILAEIKKKEKDSSLKFNARHFDMDAREYFTANKSFGKPNVGGSCVNPVKGSIFNPDESKITSSYSAISLTSAVVEIVALSSTPVCNSTAKEWAISAPMPSDPNTYFCFDSKNNQKETSTPLVGTTCK